MLDLTCPIENVADLVPHSGQMILIDQVLAFGDDFLIAEAYVGEQHILLQNGVLKSYSALEIMAQAVAAWAGCMAIKANESVRLGYLLGTRKLYLYQDDIAIGTQLKIEIKLSIQDVTGFGVFDCQLFDQQSQQLICQGALNVFSPKNDERE